MDDWVPVQGFPGYSVHPDGVVRRDANGRILRIKVNQYGLAYVGMAHKLRQCQRSLALLVANAFIPRPPKKPFDTPITLDGNRTNCAVTNLMWRPYWFARMYHRQFRYPFDMPIEAPIRDLEGDEVFPDSLEVAKRYGLLERDVVLSILNKTYAWPTYQLFEVA